MCYCCVAGLDADLLAVIPAFSRHPSLKHLMLGKNFNIKGRYGARGESTAQMAVIMMMNVFLLLSVSSGCWMKHCRNWFIWCKRKIVWVELCNILWDTHLHMYKSPGGVLHRRAPTRTLYAARSHADALLSQFKFVRPAYVYLTRISHLPQTVGANMLSDLCSHSGLDWYRFICKAPGEPCCCVCPPWQVACSIIYCCWWW